MGPGGLGSVPNLNMWPGGLGSVPNLNMGPGGLGIVRDQDYSTEYFL